MEYLFKKDEMAKLISESSESSNTVVISVNFKHGDAAGVFIGEIRATVAADPASGSRDASADPGSITGCPNPPGC